MTFQRNYFYLLILFFCLIFPTTNAQISYGGIPFGMRSTLKLVMAVEIIDMPTLDSAMIQQQNNSSKRNRLKSTSIGYTFDVNINTSNHGNWTTVNNIGVTANVFVGKLFSEV